MGEGLKNYLGFMTLGIFASILATALFLFLFKPLTNQDDRWEVNKRELKLKKALIDVDILQNQPDSEIIDKSQEKLIAEANAEIAKLNAQIRKAELEGALAQQTIDIITDLRTHEANAEKLRESVLEMENKAEEEPK